MDLMPVETETLGHTNSQPMPQNEESSEREHNLDLELLEIERPNLSPRQWSRIKKWTATLILSAFAFVQPLAETMLSPVQSHITASLKIKHAYEWLLVNSLILIGIGLAPLFLAPMSEMYGRKRVLLAGSICFIVWNTGCGAARTLPQLLVFRLLAGFGASVADALAGGVMSDLWESSERGRAFAVYMATPLLGPALGPICGAFIANAVDWRWIFWIISASSAVIVILASIFFPETYQPRLTQLRARSEIRQKTHDKRPGDSFKELRSFVTLMGTNLQRPLRMLGTQIIIQLLAIYMALLYGIMFLFLYIYPSMWADQYYERSDIGSLNYISFALGLLAGVYIAGHLGDTIYARLTSRRADRFGVPEFRIPPMIIGTILVPIGLLWWGWTGQAQKHWILPNIGSFAFATGIYICSASVSVYTIEIYGEYSASAVSTNLVTRSLTAAVFPVFAPYMFSALAFGFSCTILAGGFGIIGILVVFILWFYGEKLRKHSQYCTANGESQHSL